MKNEKTPKAKKPIYKRIWFWIIVVIVVAVIGSAIGGGGKDKDKDSSDSKSTATSKSSSSSSSSETSSSSKTSQSTTKKSSAPANTAVATDLATGDWKVGTDIKPGTYVITSTGGSGNLQTGDGEVNAILTDNSAEAGDMYTSSVRAVLKDGQDLKISGLAGAHFEPAKSLNNISSGTLNAGVYVVGQDIKPGTYTITPVKGSGNLMTDDGLVNEILGDGSDGMSVKSAHVNLKDGQVLTTSLESISLAQ